MVCLNFKVRSPQNEKTIILFSNDLRLHDNPALWEAAERGIVILVFIHPQPIVNHVTTRNRALAAFQDTKKT